MPGTGPSIPFAGSILGGYRHVCAFFSSPKEEHETLLPFVRDGLERGERAYHIVESENREEHLKRLRNAGVDVTQAQRSRQLEVATPEETYLRGGRFNKEAMLALIQNILKRGTTLRFPLTRMIAHAESVLVDWSSVDNWLEYEARLNEVLPGYDDPVICAYDSNILSATMAVDILRAHPVALIGGVELLPSLKARPNGNELILSWPTNAPGFILQSTFDLTPPVTWLDSTSVPAVIGAHFTLTNTTSAGARFYRLRKM